MFVIHLFIQMRFYLKFLLIGIVCYAREPADKGANEKTRYILNFLDTLPAQSTLNA